MSEANEMCYKPKPIQFDHPLPESIQRYMPWIGEQIHERWAEKRMQEGWEYGCQYDGENKKHPCLVSYEQLTESEKEYDLSTAAHTIQLLLHAGFQIIPPQNKQQEERSFSFTEYDRNSL